MLIHCNCSQPGRRAKSGLKKKSNKKKINKNYYSGSKMQLLLLPECFGS
jgi:hypothetical protein